MSVWIVELKYPKRHIFRTSLNFPPFKYKSAALSRMLDESKRNPECTYRIREYIPVEKEDPK